MTILLLESLHAEAEALLRDHAEAINVGERAEGLAEPGAVEAILTRGRGRIDQALMARCPQLRVVARCGVGLDNIDTGAARERGITVVYAPGTTTTAVAEHTIMLMLAAARRLRPIAQAVREGDWAIRNGYQGSELSGKTLGVVGFGRIGQRVAEIATSLGMRVVVWSRSSHSRYPSLPLEELLGAADVVSLHVALTPETRHMIGADELRRMRPGAVLINTARGAIIDEQAVDQALAEGRLGGFAADVLETEPPADDAPLLRHPDALITPHVAALTETTYRRICVETARNVVAVLRGEPPTPESVYRSD